MSSFQAHYHFLHSLRGSNTEPAWSIYGNNPDPGFIFYPLVLSNTHTPSTGECRWIFPYICGKTGHPLTCPVLYCILYTLSGLRTTPTSSATGMFSGATRAPSSTLRYGGFFVCRNCEDMYRCVNHRCPEDLDALRSILYSIQYIGSKRNAREKFV